MHLLMLLQMEWVDRREDREMENQNTYKLHGTEDHTFAPHTYIMLNVRLCQKIDGHSLNVLAS